MTRFALQPGFRALTGMGSLAALLKPDLTPNEREVAQVEGWISGVPGLIGERDLDCEGIKSHARH